MTFNKNTIWALLALLLVLGIWKLSRPGEVVSAQPWVRGNDQAQVVITEYSDFQCPACSNTAPILDRIVEEYGDNVKIEYFHYPLIPIHPNSLPAARAAEAAGVQGKFWEMHDKLFATQSEWQDDNAYTFFEKYAQELDLDLVAFKKDYNSGALLKKIHSQRAQAVAAGYNGTPTILINGQKIENPGSFAGYELLLEQFLPAQSGDVNESTESTQSGLDSGQ
jgi:protein-disulfide isomerase